MKHRNLNTEDWSRMAIDSLFDDGMLPDWKEFASEIRKDKRLAKETLVVCGYHQNTKSAALARVLVEHFYGSDEDMGLK